MKRSILQRVPFLSIFGNLEVFSGVLKLRAPTGGDEQTRMGFYPNPFQTLTGFSGFPSWGKRPGNPPDIPLERVSAAFENPGVVRPTRVFQEGRLRVKLLVQ
jgi:hypothetical protein